MVKFPKPFYLKVAVDWRRTIIVPFEPATVTLITELFANENNYDFDYDDGRTCVPGKSNDEPSIEVISGVELNRQWERGQASIARNIAVKAEQPGLAVPPEVQNGMAAASQENANPGF